MRRAALAVCLTSRAFATWAGGAADPLSSQQIAVDETGELVSEGFATDWPFGFEDVANNGTMFPNQEQSVDIRTAYAVCDMGTLWMRIFVSDPGNASANIRVYFFLDTDGSSATGGDAGADAAAIQPDFTSDPSMGGYEYCLEVRGNGNAQALWQWTGSAYVDPMTTTAMGEAGNGTDAIGINGAAHGYLQGSMPTSDLGLADCDAVVLFIRSWNDTTPMSYGDTEIGAPSTIPGPGAEPGLDGPADGPVDGPIDRPLDGGSVDGAPGDGGPADDGSHGPDGTAVLDGGPEGPDAPTPDPGTGPGGKPCADDEDCGARLVCHPIDLVCVDWFAPPGGVTQGGACSCRLGDPPSGAGVAMWTFLLAMLARYRRRRS